MTEQSKIEIRDLNRTFTFRRHRGYWNLIPQIIFCPKLQVREAKLRRSMTLGWLCWSLYIKLEPLSKGDSDNAT